MRASIFPCRHVHCSRPSKTVFLFCCASEFGPSRPKRLPRSSSSTGVRAGRHSSATHVVQCTTTSVAPLDAGTVLTGHDVVLSSYDEELFEPSRDLRELAAAQLQSMFQVLARLSPSDARSWRACVYARRADSLEAPQIRLQRVACWPSRIKQPASQWSPGSAGTTANDPNIGSFGSCTAAGYEEMDDMLTLHRPAWEGGSSSATCDAEASLVQEEMVLLPSSNLLVLPLAEAGVLVGLMVVEVAQSVNLTQASSTTRSSSSSTGVGAVSEDALWCLRMAVPPLSKACAMDLRTALAGAQQEAQQRLARSLLTEARGPLKVLGTFGAMLAPRLRANRDSLPESDMADGMVMQGQRLADVVAQLEAALRPSSVAAVRGLPQQQQLQLPAANRPRAAAASEDGYDDVPAVSTGSKLQQYLPPGQQTAAPQQQLSAPVEPAMVKLPAAAKAGYLPEHCTDSSSTAASNASEGYQREQQLQVVAVEAPHIPGQWAKPAPPLQSSSRDIRWSRVQPTHAPAMPAAASSRHRSSSGTCSAYYSAKQASGTIDMQKTIDLEATPADIASGTSAAAAPVRSDSSTIKSIAPDAIVSSSSRSSSRTAKRQRLQQAAATAVTQSVYCNMVEALSHLLTAASRLAQAQGVNFIVNHPLQLDQPMSQPSGAGSNSSSSSRGDSPSSTGSPGTGESVALLPRPIRPLLVGMAASTCRRVLGYVLDVALQCTPRGGQLCVTARQCSGGVEVNVLHSGKAQPSRLHTTSKSLNPQLYSQLSESPSISSNESSSGNLQRGQTQQDGWSSNAGSVVAVKGRDAARLSVQELASGSSLRNSSSLVSLDFAGQVLRSIGGRLSVVYPCHFMNAISGQLEVGSSIEVWLPPPPATT